MSEPMDKIKIEVEVNSQNAESGIKKLNRTLDRLTQLTNRVGKESGKAQNSSKTAWGKIGDNIKKATSHTQNFLRSLSRIAMYRAIRTVLAEISGAFRTGVNNLYEYSRIVGTSFAPAMDAATSSLTTFKNSIGAAVAPLIQSLIPVLQKICAWLVKVNNLLASFFAALSGKSTYTAAIAYADQYGESLDKAGKAAKELQKYLAPFDELNVLPEASSANSGGGGASTPDYGSMFQEMEINPKIKEIVQWIQDHLQLIKDLALAIGAAFLAWKIASLFTDNLRKIWGITIGILGTAVAVQGAFDAWENGVNWTNLGEMMGGVAAAALGFGMAFGTTGAAIALLVGGIGMLTVGMRDWIKTGELSTETFWLLEAGIAAVGIALGLLISPWALVVAAVAAAALAIYKYWDEIKEFFERIWGTVATWFNDNVIQPIVHFVEETKEKILAIIGAFVTAIHKHWDEIVEFFTRVGSAIGNWFNDHIIQPIKDFLSPLIEWLSEFVRGCWIIVEAVWIVVSDWFNENVIQPVVNFFSEMWEKVSKFFGDAWEKIKIIWNVAAAWFNIKVITPIKDFFTERWEAIKNVFSNAWEGIKKIWEPVSKWFKDKIIDPLSKAFGTAWDTIKTAFEKAFNGISNVAKSIFNGIISLVEGVINRIIRGINNLISGFNKVVDWAAGVTGASWSGLSLINEISLPRFENGGFPDSGQLFIAREAGAELVGAIGKKTAVANNDQIVEGISEGVKFANEDVVTAVIAAAQQIVQSIRDKDTATYLDGNKISQHVTASQNRANRMYGRTLQMV